MRQITQKQSDEFLKRFTKAIIKLGAIQTKADREDVRTFELNTRIGKLTISVDFKQSYGFWAWSRFANAEEAWKVFGHHKYNFCGTRSNKETIKEVVEQAIEHFKRAL